MKLNALQYEKVGGLDPKQLFNINCHNNVTR